MAVTVAAGEVRIRHGAREVAVHKQSEGRHLRIVDGSTLTVSGRDGAVRRAEIAAPTVQASASPPSSLLRPLAEYEPAIGGRF